MRPPVLLFQLMKINAVSRFTFRCGIRSFSAVAILALTLAPALRSAAAEAQASPRERSSFNTDWRFIKGDPEGVGATLSYTNIKAWVMTTGAEYSMRPPS